MEFYCNGTLETETGIILCAKNERFDFPLNEHAASTLAAKCAPSKFGIGKQHVYDVSYRNAYSLTTEDFCTNFSPYNRPSLLKKINDLFVKPSFVRLEKLNVYPTGGFFKLHKDTPKPDLMGTLVVCLPTQFDGGEFKIENDSIVFESNKLSYVAFFSERDHQVLPVKRGTRVTLTYGVYAHKPTENDNIEQSVYDLIHSDETTKRLAYGCSNMSVKKMLLKGKDFVLFNWLKHNGCDPEIKAILDHDEGMLDFHEKLRERMIEDGVVDVNEDDCVEDAILFSDVYAYREQRSFNGNTADPWPLQKDYEIGYHCKIIEESSCEKIHLSPKCDCYGNEPYADEEIYHYYYIVFRNPNLKVDVTKKRPRIEDDDTIE